MTTYHRRRLAELKHALDEARFGAEGTLNLRASLPTVHEATARAETWLRERQVAGVREVLIVTGRGNASADGHSVVRAAIEKLLRTLRRRGVVDVLTQHTPGSFVVQLAPMRRLWEAPKRHRDKAPRPAPAETAALAGLAPETTELLRTLARQSLHRLGVGDAERFLADEMATQLAAFVRGLPEGADREARLRDAIARALQDDEQDAR